MEEIKIFSNKDFGQIRTIEVDGKIHFVGNDIAKALGYKDTTNAIKQHCRGVVKHHIGVQTGIKRDGSPAMQQINMNIIPEGDLYRLIMNSELPSAEKFESWVFDEVLPQIRKTGGYIPVDEDDSDSDILARAILISQKMIEEKNKQLMLQKDTITELLPKAKGYDHLIDSKGLFSMMEVAKSLNIGMGRNEFMELLRDMEILQKHSRLPYECYIKSGYFKVKNVNLQNGYVEQTTKITPKGVDYIVKRLHREEMFENYNSNKRTLVYPAR